LERFESDREREAKAFRKWFSEQKRFGSLVAMERALDITKDYLHLIKGGARRAVDPELRAKLHKVTGLDIFGPIPRKVGTKKPEARRKHSKRTRFRNQQISDDNGKSRKTVRNAYERATEIKKLLVTLADRLEFFKQDSESRRDAFREVVPGEDIGYITTLLRALYNEDRFQRWLLFSKYDMKSREED